MNSLDAFNPSPENIQALDALVEALLDDVRIPETDPVAAHSAALKLVRLLAPAAAAARARLAPWQKRKIDRYLRTHLQRPLPLDMLAGQIPLGLRQFCQAFKKSYGTPPRAYIARLRVDQAKRLMLSTEDSLSDIAMGCGLANRARLSKLFGRIVGETPSMWRQRNLRDASLNPGNNRATEGPHDYGMPRRDRAA